MSDNQLRPLGLDDVLSFNDELLTLARTGLPFELEPGDDYAALTQKLAHANAKLALQVGRGQPLEEAMSEVRELTPQYRAALQTWFRCDKSVDAFNALTTSAEGRRQIQADISYSFLQPLILLCLVYCGFSYLVLVTAPKLEMIYTQTWQTPSRSLQVLMAARRTQPIWGLLVPLLIASGIAVWRWRAGRWEFRWLPWRAKTLAAIRKANYAQSVACLIERDYSLGQSLALLGPMPDASTDAQANAAATQRLIEAERFQQPLSIVDPVLQPLPPMLRWAFTSGLTGQPLANVLHFASRTYFEMARRKQSFWRVWLPIILSTVIGGCLVLLFGLSLFVPMVEMLKSLTRPEETMR